MNLSPFKVSNELHHSSLKDIYIYYLTCSSPKCVINAQLSESKESKLYDTQRSYSRTIGVKPPTISNGFSTLYTEIPNFQTLFLRVASQKLRAEYAKFSRPEWADGHAVK